jgi:pyridoxamine 5'-phosphate oxidase
MSTADPAPTVDPLVAGLDRVWAMLAAAIADPSASLRTPVVANVCNGAADGRVMVVRAVDRDRATLTFFTDSRAAKVAAVTAEPHVAVIAYDSASRLQFRLCGVAQIAVTGATVESAWATVPPGARRSYRTRAAPGTPSPGPTALLADGDGRAAFAVLTVIVDSIEWLDLATPGHRRAIYRREPEWRGGWIVP